MLSFVLRRERALIICGEGIDGANKSNRTNRSLVEAR